MIRHMGNFLAPRYRVTCRPLIGISLCLFTLLHVASVPAQDGAKAARKLESVTLGLSAKHGLHVTSGPRMRTNRNRIVDFALKSRSPSMWDNREFVDAGGLMSYGADEADSYRRVTYYVDRILKGAKPADLPVEQPTKVELVINLKTAKQIGLTIPPNVLVRADKVIK